MKKFRVLLYTAFAAATMVWASSSPSSAASYILSTTVDTPMLSGDTATFGGTAATTSPFQEEWFFSLSQPGVVAAAGGTNTFGFLDPMRLSIWNLDTNSEVDFVHRWSHPCWHDTPQFD